MPGSHVNNTNIIQQEDNDGNDKIETADHNNNEDADKIRENSIHDEELLDFTGNNTNLPLEENFEVEENNNASTDSSVEIEVDTNVTRKQKRIKKTLFGFLSSDSSESSEEEHSGDAGEDLKRIIDCFSAHKNVSEEPHGTACGNAAKDDWKQRSTKTTQATLNSVRVKEEPTLPKDVLVPNTEALKN
eukprot:7083435-Ditylum_brightwellii.AAC.1